MKLLVKIFAVILVILVIVIGVSLFLINRYVQSDEFKQTVLKSARDTVGSEVKIDDLKVSLLSGVSIKGFTVSNPQGFKGDMLTADSFVLRYQLLPLMRRKLVVNELTIEKPRIYLAQDSSGKWNYEKLATDKPKPQPATPPSGSSTASSPVDIELSQVAIKQGGLTIFGEQDKLLASIENFSLQTSVDLEGNKLSGSGTARIDTISVANSLFIKSITSPVIISREEMKLSSLKGGLAGGAVSGNMTLRLEGGAKYMLDVQVANADLEKLLTEAGIAKKVISGKLGAKAAIQGTGGLPTISGNGEAQMADGALAKMPLQELVALLLLLPDLSTIRFDECRIEFSIADNTLQTPVIRLTSPLVHVTGHGSVSLADYTLKHQMQLAIAKEMLDKMPKEVRGIFAQRQDGFYTLDFKVWGPYSDPQTDIKERLIKGGAEQLLKKGIEKLFK